MTVLLAEYITGTERLPLLAVGKAVKPRCFKSTKQLPLDCHFNQKA